MHSYMAHNGMLATVQARLEKERRHLDELVNSLPGGREQALAAAANRQNDLETQEASEITPAPTPGPGTPGVLTVNLPLGSVNSQGNGLTGYDAPAGAISQLNGINGSTGNGYYSDKSNPDIASTTTATDLATTAARRRSSAAALGHNHPGLATSPELRQRTPRRKRTHAQDSLPAPDKSLPHGTSLEPSHSTTPHEPRPPLALAWHPDEHVALLARNIGAMEEELTSNGKKGLVWPQNVSYRHFADFMIIPTLVYQLEYPRTET
jgi:sterol O-acyltransferase